MPSPPPSRRPVAEVTPARLAMVKVVRWVPVTLAVVGGVMDVALAAAGLASSLTWMMTSFIVMQRQRQRRRGRGHGPLTRRTDRPGSSRYYLR